MPSRRAHSATTTRPLGLGQDERRRREADAVGEERHGRVVRKSLDREELLARDHAAGRRLVASTMTPGHERVDARPRARRPPPGRARSCRARAGTADRRGSRRVPRAGSPPPRRPTDAMTTSPTSAGSPTPARYATAIPASNDRDRWATSSSASLVLPLPPGPVIVRSRLPARSDRRRASSSRRPTNDVDGGRAPLSSTTLICTGPPGLDLVPILLPTNPWSHPSAPGWQAARCRASSRA